MKITRKKQVNDLYKFQKKCKSDLAKIQALALIAELEGLRVSSEKNMNQFEENGI